MKTTGASIIRIGNGIYNLILNVSNANKIE